VDLWNGASNIRVFKALEGETFAFPDLEMSVWGKPLTFSQGFAVQPLAGAPFPQGNKQWRIAMVHGYYVHPEPTPFINSHVRQEEIVNSSWDYIALGHSINFECVCSEPVKAYYCGSPSTTGTVAIVDFAEDKGVQATCHSL
jgi:DNA repair exonuclease SbcCD nuclease subunit